MEARFIKISGEIVDLGKKIDQKEISLKILRGLPSSWDMKVTAMRDHRDLKTLSTDKLFSDLKAYEFEMKARMEEEREERNNALVVEQPSTSRKFKKFMKKGTSKKFPQAMSKNQFDNAQEEIKSKERKFKKDKRKALISDPLESSESDESSSDESDTSKDDNALFCMELSSESSNQDFCLMAHETEENEVTSNSFDSTSTSFSSESISHLMRDCQTFMDTYSQIEERNNSLTLEKEEINEKLQNALLEVRNLNAEIIRLQEECKSREV
ncbi:uncharacterized protein LOC116004080 [Ipomoea triloba]|uniref:uncharacterized protein LOC116004080 n=1 Tax=Ipomoea triloba TaxID=35885 RepID=UPI00125D5889|nr:uncharacterized protein LOC116004080 [Ipomoea triloba]